jgi:hypothetical protein
MSIRPLALTLAALNTVCVFLFIFSGTTPLMFLGLGGSIALTILLVLAVNFRDEIEALDTQSLIGDLRARLGL